MAPTHSVGSINVLYGYRYVTIIARVLCGFSCEMSMVGLLYSGAIFLVSYYSLGS